MRCSKSNSHAFPTLSVNYLGFCLLDLDACCEMFTAVLSVTSIVTGRIVSGRELPLSSPGGFLCQAKKKSKLYGTTCFLLLGWPLLSLKGFLSMRRFSRYLHCRMFKSLQVRPGIQILSTRISRTAQTPFYGTYKGPSQMTAYAKPFPRHMSVLPTPHTAFCPPFLTLVQVAGKKTLSCRMH